MSAILAFTDFNRCSIEPDEWNSFSYLRTELDGYSDSSFAGCDYRLPTNNTDYDLAVNIVVTGRKSHSVYAEDNDWYKTRVRIEFVGDGEPSTFTGAWMFTNKKVILTKEMLWEAL